MKDLMGYCHAMYKTGFKHIDLMSEDKLSRVRMRRHIQTRAYSAYSLLHDALNSGAVISRKKPNTKFADVLVEIKHYINSLETMIQILCKKNSKLTQMERILKRNDQIYSHKIQSFFKSKDLWMSKRILLFPRLKTTTSIFGVIDNDAKISKSEMSKLNRELITNFCAQKLSLMTAAKTTSAKRASGKLIDLMAIISKNGKKWTAKEMKAWRTAYNKLLLDPEILDTWSIPLALIDPANNSFREILFIYT